MLKVEVNTADLERVVHSMPSVLKREMDDALNWAVLKFFKTFNPRLSGRPGILSRRGEGIRKRFKWEIISSEDGMVQGRRIFVRSKVAVRHEFGGDLEGQGGKRIPVPLSARGEYLMSGIYQGFGRVRTRFREGRNKNIRPMRIGGKWFLAEVRTRQGEEEKVLPLFVLKNKVTYPARLGFYDTWDRLRDTIYQGLAKRLMSGIKKEWASGEVSFRV